MHIGTEYDNFVKNHPDFDEDKCTEKYLNKIADDFINSKNKITSSEKKYWLVFDKDHGNREDCNVYYSSLVHCRTKEEALIIVAIDKDRPGTKKLDAIEMKLKTIDTMNKFYLSDDESDDE